MYVQGTCRICPVFLDFVDSSWSGVMRGFKGSMML